MQESSVRVALTAATEDGGVGPVNPIGKAHALMRVSEPTAVAITTMPISAYATVARFFRKPTERSKSFTSAGGDRLTVRWPRRNRANRLLVLTCGP